MIFFSDLGEVITESDQHYFYLCMKCKENGFRSTDCRYVNCNESINPKVFCTKVYLLPFLFYNILEAQYVSTHFEMLTTQTQKIHQIHVKKLKTQTDTISEQY